MAAPSAISEGRAPCPACGYLAAPGPATVNFCPKCGQDLRAGAGADERTETHALLEQVIADRYRLVALIGEGGMGAVYKAEHIRMGKALAVKILRGDFARDPAATARFKAEAQIVSRLSHPHTIAVFDFGEIEALGGFYLAMEYVPGKDLALALRDEQRFPEPRAVEIGQQILGSLAEAHEAGIVHRDMKPGNVMLMQTRPGEDFAKVLDFGIAKLRDEGPGSSTTTTTTVGAIVGTPSYLAPEQARGDGVDARSDLYAVGCLLYELVAGRPPFTAPSPMAVVAAHLHEAPPPLLDVAPGTSRAFAEIVHRALQKRPADRFQSADEFRAALLGLAAPAAPRRAPAPARITGELALARREDFRDFDRQVAALRRSRIAAPLSAALLLAAAGAAAWRWDDLYTFVATRAPAVAQALPRALRPSDHFDGVEHEPNDVASQANPLPLPPGKDGRPAGGVAVVRGFVGAKLSDTVGDADVYRLEIPAVDGRKVLVAEWHGERAGDGIRGLDVTLSLNRERGEGEGRSSAPLVASVDRGGPGRPERLVAAVRPGAYYLTVRERHDEATGPVEKPSDPYLLEVHLEDPGPGEEIEPNDAPEEVGAREQRYPEWRELAEANALGEGSAAVGETSTDDPDTWAIRAGGPAEAPQAVVAVPDPGVALAARLWIPDATDLAPPRNADRVRWEDAATGGPGELLFLALPSVPREGAPALLQLRAAEGEGRYLLLALGPGSGSGAAVQARIRALADAGRLPSALELAAGFARHVPRSPARREVLVLAGGLAEEAAPRLSPDEVVRFDRAARALGAAIFDVEDGAVRYRAGFEARVEGKDRLAEVAALRAARLAAPCTPEELAARIEAFLERFPEAEHAAEARRWRARALEEALARAGGKDPALAQRAIAAWERLATGAAADEARAALARLRAKGGPVAPPGRVCPDPAAPR
ncbi:protein kinase domain-containing protein [Anaeromyxobacter oryzisoli]|uniref:protein kinase domain-containing protein n=1 Tax=Anaeromyxobacter oryzisoli TaxID=2925408 RepID=UPI001F59B085|nr:protein kinase [Anaeromyxobacter sp. SG63]